MDELDWQLFAQLPGGVRRNWERLCHDVVHRGLGGAGSVRATAQQPGVEFHLKVDFESSALGEPGRWWGWQCRWYTLDAGRQIGTTRRAKVEEAIRKTVKYVPEITDWVLWTRFHLTPTDQSWFYNIETEMRLHLWTAREVATHLVGDAAVLRRTYFGDLMVTPHQLDQTRKLNLAPVTERWIPEVHLELGAEERIRRILGEVAHWPELVELETGLSKSIEELDALVGTVDLDMQPDIDALLADLRDLVGRAGAFRKDLGAGSVRDVLVLAREEWNPQMGSTGGPRLARTVRRRGFPWAFTLQAAIFWHWQGGALSKKILRELTCSVVAVVGPAGSGKTHFGAALTAARGRRPCGVFIEAWPMKARGTTNDLVERVQGIEASTFEELLEAVEAAGARAGTRIPLVVDGLNESEDPEVWKGELERLHVLIGRFEYIVVVVTVRPLAVEFVLPEKTKKIELEGFGPLTHHAIKKYFEYYKINAGSAQLPIDRMQTPLFMRIFCEATNPDRRKEVGPGHIPSTLVAVFAMYRTVLVDRICRQPGGLRFEDGDVLRALDEIALHLWKENARQMQFSELRELIGDDTAEWTKSLGRLLVDVGILRRNWSPEEAATGFVFDAFGGFLIADVHTRNRSKEDVRKWIAEEAARLSDDREMGHPLASDARASLVGLVPRATGIQLWHVMEGDLRIEALVAAAGLEGHLLDTATAQELAAAWVALERGHRHKVLGHARERRDAVNHALNARFLDELLQGESVAERDLGWSEWVRSEETRIARDLKESAVDWESRGTRTEEDHLRALWVKWVLTTTVRPLRDYATLALYWYGRGSPDAIFRLTLRGLRTNDPYVPERLLAAAYGVLMAAPGEGRDLGDDLAGFLNGLWASFCGDDTKGATEHWLVREYVVGMVHLASRYYSAALGQWTEGIEFTSPRRPEPILRDAGEGYGGDLVYGMDFKNYTVGGLVPGRGSYQFEHPEYQEVLSWIRGRVRDLGWRSDRFSEVDKRIISSRRRHHRRRDGQLDPYQKKYGWIGYHEAAGRLVDEGRLILDSYDGRISEMGVDPSFPRFPPAFEGTIPEWTSSEPRDLGQWVKEAQVEVPDALFRAQSLCDCDGPWVALGGYLRQENTARTCEVFGFLDAILVRRQDSGRLLAALQEKGYPGNHWIPEAPQVHYCFSGEMPWHARVRGGLGSTELRRLYSKTISIHQGPDIPVEIPVHQYSWESYHSLLNKAGGHPIPSVALAEAFDLRVVPNSLNWCDSEGRLASMTFSRPLGFKGGCLVYSRDDLIRRYCEEHDYELVWMMWGERNLIMADPMGAIPDWLRRVYADRLHIWRRITTLSEMRALPTLDGRDSQL